MIKAHGVKLAIGFAIGAAFFYLAVRRIDVAQMRAALAGWAGSAAAAEEPLVAAGVDPTVRGEMLDVGAFARIAGVRATAARA